MIQLNNISKTYNQGKPNEVQALKELNLTIRRGEMVAIMGPSGSGKSTLLNIIGCMDDMTSGEYILDGELVNSMNSNALAKLRNKKIGFVLQNFGLLYDRTVEENIIIPLLFAKDSLRKTKKRIKIILEDLGISELANRKAAQLSGGQAQRVAIARALVNEPEIILADEPTGALDTKTAEDVVEVLKELNQKGKTILIVTHNPSVAAACQRTYIIKDGLISLLENAE